MSAARPETGATDADIEAAAKRVWVSLHPGDDHPWPFPSDRLFADIVIDMQNDIRDNMGSAAEALVPPGSVIALAEHVVSAADREAIGLSLDVLDCIDRWRMTPVADRDADATLGIMADKLTPEHRERLIRLAATSARMERLGSGGEETT